MDDSRTKKLALGGVVAAATALLGGMIVMFGGSPKIFTTKKPYTIIFDEAPGVLVGTPVRRSGVVIGEVTSVDLDNITAKVRVGIVLGDKYTIKTNEQPVVIQDLFSRNTSIDFIPAGTAAPVIEPPPGEIPKLQPPVPIEKSKDGTVRRAGFFPDGEALAQIPAGKEPEPPKPVEPVPPKPAEPVPPGSVIQGRPSGDARVLIDQASALLPTVQKTLDAMRISIEKFGAVAPALEQGAREFTDLGRSMRELVPEIRRTNDEIRILVTNVRITAPELKKTNDELQVAIQNFSGLGERLNVLLQANQPKIESTLANADKTAQQATIALQRITDLFTEENVRNATATLRAVQSASAQFDGILRDADALLKEGTNTAKQATTTLQTADSAFKNIDAATKPLADRGDRILRNLDASFDNLNRVLIAAGEVLAPLGRADGTVSRLFNDPSLYNNLNSAVCMATKLLPRLDQILKDVEVFADKIARHPESIGLGGAVRPSAGLKDMPTPQPPPGVQRRP
ncbi:MAG: MlaD family protein [Gemmataceae bacterium]